jgi:hypothetical protein
LQGLFSPLLLISRVDFTSSWLDRGGNGHQ